VETETNTNRHDMTNANNGCLRCIPFLLNGANSPNRYP